MDGDIAERISTAGFLLEHVSETGSTNSDLLRAGSAGENAGKVLVADLQLAGRGRLERTWDAPAGSSLLCSVLLRPSFDIARARLLPAAAGLSLQDAVCECDVATELKWPNDLMVGDRKLAGVLSETVSSGHEWFAVVGIGCNVSWGAVNTSSTDLQVPPEVLSRVVSLDEFTRSANRWQLLARYLELLGNRLKSIDAVAQEYADRCATTGRQVQVQTLTGTFEAIACAIADDGGLIVESNGTQRVLHEGDVVHLR